MMVSALESTHSTMQMLTSFCTGVVPLSPACHRALEMVVENLKLSGYDVVEL